MTKRQAKIHAREVGKKIRQSGSYATHDRAMTYLLYREAARVLGRAAWGNVVAGWQAEADAIKQARKLEQAAT